VNDTEARWCCPYCGGKLVIVLEKSLDGVWTLAESSARDLKFHMDSGCAG